jgi:hypothetical protein
VRKAGFAMPLNTHPLHPARTDSSSGNTSRQDRFSRFTLDMLYADASDTEEPECRSEPQPDENGEQHTSPERQRPALEAA